MATDSIDLTILLFADAEKPIAWDTRYFGAIREMNMTAHERIQVLVMSQRKSSWSIRQVVAHEPYEVEVIDCDHPRDSTGYPVWDVVEATRKVWPKIKGQYVSFNHIEYIHGPWRLGKTCDWLMANRPQVALGNLRRIDADIKTNRKRRTSADDPLNNVFAQLIDDCYWAFLQDHWEMFGNKPWIFWIEEPHVGDTRWLEDVFFADREWFESLKFFEHGGRLPFQDVYDLMGMAMQKLDQHGLAPKCHRLPRAIHDACHILHERGWGSYAPTMRQWFLEHVDEFADTTLARGDLWEIAAQPGGLGDEKPFQAVVNFRRAPGGTVTRWTADFSGWLRQGGAEALLEKFGEWEMRSA